VLDSELLAVSQPVLFISSSLPLYNLPPWPALTAPRSRTPCAWSQCRSKLRLTASRQRPAPAATTRSSADDGMWLHDKAPGTRARGPTGRGAAPAGASNGAPRTKLRVTNLQYEITPKDLLVRTLLRMLASSVLMCSAVHLRAGGHPPRGA
jgi:hypothetical protein